MLTKKRELNINLREYDSWTVGELALALELSEDEAKKRLEELLALEVVIGDEWNGYKFNETYRQMNVTVVKQSGIVTLLQWIETWQWNRLMRKDAKERARRAAKYQRDKFRSGPMTWGRFGSRY